MAMGAIDARFERRFPRAREYWIAARKARAQATEF